MNTEQKQPPTLVINGFEKGGLHFVVPLKCGLTAFTTAARRRTVQHTNIAYGRQVCAVARSPIARLKSFFHDKLETNVNPHRVQDCQRTIMKLLGCSKCEDLKRVSFEGLVRLLKDWPKQEWDPHIWPFVDTFRPFEVTHLINLDLPQHSHCLFKFLGLNPADAQSYNKTFKPLVVTLSEEAEELLRVLYAEDFEYLDAWAGKTALPEAMCIHNAGMKR